MYEILPHTADVKVKAKGESLEGLLNFLLQGMFAAAEPRFENEKVIERSFSVRSSDQVALVVDFLSEALALSDINSEAYTNVRFSSITDISAEGVLIGKSVSGFETQIKAATYHDLEIKKFDGEFEATVTFDV